MVWTVYGLKVVYNTLDFYTIFTHLYCTELYTSFRELVLLNW